VFDLATDIRALAPGEGVRWTTTILEEVEPPIVRRHDANETRGGSQPDEWHSLAAEVLRIDRRRENPVKRGLIKHFRARHLFRTAPRFMCST
jgi:hypothetical protein